MSKHTIETVTFRLASGVSKEAFLNTIPLSTTFVTTRTGFLSRRLSCADNGDWTEHIEWASLEDAQAASKAFMQNKTLIPFMQCIDGQNATMSYSQLEVSIS